MKTKLSTLAVVEYFLKSKKNNRARAIVVSKIITAEKQLRRGILMSFFCLALISLAIVFNSIEVLYNQKIVIVCSVLALIGSIFATKKICANYWKLVRLHRFSGYERQAAKEVMVAIGNFKKLFGRRPEKLGTDGVTKKLTACAKRSLKFENKARLTKNEFERVEWLLAQQRQRDQLGEMYDAAKFLMPVRSYEEIFALAGAKQFLVLL